MSIDEGLPRATRAEVEARAGIEFPHADVAEVLSALEQYGVLPHETEVHRVHLAVLKLSHGVWPELEAQVQLAKRDYRDVLAYAEYPAYMAIRPREGERPDPQAVELAKRSDLKQYSDWRNITPR